MSSRYAVACLIALACAQALAAEVALVMSVQGKVARLGEDAPAPVEAFVKLKEGELLSLENDSRVRMLYFDNGRQESWSGPGRLELALREGKGRGLAAPQVNMLPLVVARQLARTPTPDSQGRGGAMRLRTLPNREAVAKLQDTYQGLRNRAAAGDLGPQMYLLSGLFELRELEQVEKVLAELQREWPGNPEATLLRSLYRKAVRNARESAN